MQLEDALCCLYNDSGSVVMKLQIEHPTFDVMNRAPVAEVRCRAWQGLISERTLASAVS